jgi:hypothetical protein
MQNGVPLQLGCRTSGLRGTILVRHVGVPQILDGLKRHIYFHSNSQLTTKKQLSLKHCIDSG